MKNIESMCTIYSVDMSFLENVVETPGSVHQQVRPLVLSDVTFIPPMLHGQSGVGGMM